MRLLPLLALLLLGSCAPAPVARSAPAVAPAGNGPSAIPDPEGQLSDMERQEIAALIAATVQVLQTPAFERNLAAAEAEFGEIAQSAMGARLPAARVAQLMAGRDPGHRFHPARIRSQPARWSTTSTAALINLVPVVLEDWRHPTPRRRSLAINSLAHEFSHTLSRRPDRLAMIFTDSGYEWGWLRGRPPVASYTIGSVAQCTWLDEQGLMPEGLVACLRCHGVRNFTPRRDAPCRARVRR